MNEQQGLAQQQAMGGGQQGMQTEEMLKQVVQLLMQGVTPEELMAKGVPQEVIEAAMRIMQQQQMQQQAPAEGLAGQYVQSAQ